MRRGLIVVATVALLVVGSGCGGDGGDADPAGPPGPGAAGATPASTESPAGPGDSGGTGEVPESLEFAGTTIGGEQFDAATLAGEPVVLWFWAPWCPLCHAAAPDVLAAAEQVTVVGVGGLDQDSAMPGFVDRTGTGELIHLSDPDGQVWQKFDVVTQDTYVLLDADGEVVFNGGLSGSELRDRAADLAGG